MRFWRPNVLWTASGLDGHAINPVLFFATITLLFSVLLSVGDVIILKSGQVVNGEVLQKDASGILIKLDYGTFTYPASMVKDFKKEPAATENGNRSQAEEPEQRIPNWGTIITQFAKRKWATELKQIPASVIDNGILQNVPYISFSAAYGYELNIYGDPDSPAGVEIGVTRYLLNNNSAKSNCIEFITSILPSDYDRTTLLQLKWIRDFKVLNGFTFEITPPTDADAYGGWWISVYDTNKLNIARASERELHDITEFRQAIAQHPRSAANTSVAIKTNTAPSTWTGEDFRSTYSHRSVSSGGSVFVRGYYRKDGTYVQSHTRRAPRR